MFKILCKDDLDILIKNYILFQNSRGDSWTDETARKRISQILDTTDSLFVGIFEDDLLKGFSMGYFKQFDDILLFYLEEIMIFNEYQNNGLGNKLMIEIERIAKERGASKISLLTTEDDRHQRFYGRLGFKRSGLLVPMNKNIGR
ncbi:MULTISPECIES: GNAT family N-acetyltransferase [Peptoniphilus]|uniref:GNAT family N-acetyltransferase n=1 Tax=Peptoniphilus TaxID=162289 RepID=UPI0001DA9A80|nr:MULTISPECIES: GNAT family N-acetyltransferase [Peptoniphilus]EFI41946.1 acetyltransferase, GNAT family [Peptoniphilus sp. oral taxon 386 str. F0131]